MSGQYDPCAQRLEEQCHPIFIEAGSAVVVQVRRCGGRGRSQGLTTAHAQLTGESDATCTLRGTVTRTYLEEGIRLDAVCTVTASSRCSCVFYAARDRHGVHPQVLAGAEAETPEQTAFRASVAASPLWRITLAWRRWRVSTSGPERSER